MASPLKLEKFGEMAEFDGSVTVQSSFRTNNPTDISYFLTIDIDSYPTDAIPPISLNFVSTPTRLYLCLRLRTLRTWSFHSSLQTMTLSYTMILFLLTTMVRQ